MQITEAIAFAFQGGYWLETHPETKQTFLVSLGAGMLIFFLLLSYTIKYYIIIYYNIIIYILLLLYYDIIRYCLMFRTEEGD
jgi:hypothetical protein